MGTNLRADLLRIDRVFSAVDDVLVERVFDVRRPVVGAVVPLRVRIVLGEQKRRRALGVEVMFPEVDVVADEGGFAV